MSKLQHIKDMEDMLADLLCEQEELDECGDLEDRLNILFEIENLIAKINYCTGKYEC